MRYPRYPLLFKVLLIILFFLPLESVAMPARWFGIWLGVSSVASLVLLLLIFVDTCLDPSRFSKFFYARPYHNRFIFVFLGYILFSILYYYSFVFMNYNTFFGDRLSFFNSWRGRPFGQFIALFVYGIIPFYGVQYYARQASLRSVMERTFVATTLLLVYYGIFLQVSYLFGGPLTSSNIFDRGKVYSLHSYLLRFYSLGGEPRDFGTFIIGAMLLYVSVRYGAMTKWSMLNVLLMVGAFFLSSSTSGYLSASITLFIIFADAIFRGRIKIRWKHIKYSLLAVVMIGLIVSRWTYFRVIAAHSTINVQNIITGLSDSKAVVTRLSPTDMILVLYLQEIPRHGLGRLMLGYGYGNFLTPVIPILKDYFGRDVTRETGHLDTNIYIQRLIIELGLLGFIIYIALFLYTLKLNNRLLAFARLERNRIQYGQFFFLRLSYIAFFVSASIQSSHYHFIIMGLIIGTLNSMSMMRRNDSQKFTLQSSTT